MKKKTDNLDQILNLPENDLKVLVNGAKFITGDQPIKPKPAKKKKLKSLAELSAAGPFPSTEKPSSL